MNNSVQVVLADLLQSYKRSKLERLECMDLGGFIDNRVLKALRVLAKAVPKEEMIYINKVYLELLRQIDKKDLNILITLCNDAFAAGEQIKGSEYNDEIEYRVYNILNKLVSMEILQQNQYNTVSEVLQKYNSTDLVPSLELICERIIEGDIFGIKMLISTFCSFRSFRDQFICIESQLSAIVETFKKIKSLDIFIQIFNFLNTLLVTSVFSIKMSGKIIKYKPNTLKYYHFHTKSFEIIWSIIKIISETDVIISQNLIKIIPKVWNIYKAYRFEMVSDIIYIIKAIMNSSYIESITVSAKFLYSVFNDPEVEASVKGIIKSELGALMDDPGFKYSKPVVIDFDNLVINDGFPLMAEIEAGEKFSINIAVEPGCILYCAFVIDNYDILFKIQAPDSEILSVKYQKTSDPFSTKHAFKETVIVKLEWDNSYSWINSKQLRYRVLILHPVEPRGPILQYKSTLDNPDLVPVSAVIYDGYMIISTPQTREELYNTEFPLESLKDFVAKYENYSLNVLTRFQVHIDHFKGLENVLHGIDIEVAGIYLYKKQGFANIIVFSDQDIPRSCVVINGEVLKSSYKVGDVYNIISYGAVKAIKTLVDLFCDPLVLLFDCKDSYNLKQELASISIKTIELDLEPEDIASQMRELI